MTAKANHPLERTRASCSFGNRGVSWAQIAELGTLGHYAHFR